MIKSIRAEYTGVFNKKSSSIFCILPSTMLYTIFRTTSQSSMKIKMLFVGWLWFSWRFEILVKEKIL